MAGKQAEDALGPTAAGAITQSHFRGGEIQFRCRELADSAISSSQGHCWQNIAFPNAADTQPVILCFLISRACVPCHPHLAVMSAHEIGKKVKLVGTKVQDLSFNLRGMGGICPIAGVFCHLFLPHGLEQGAPRTKESGMLWFMPSKHAEQTQCAGQLVTKPATLIVVVVDTVHVLCAAGPGLVWRLGNVVPLGAVISLNRTLEGGMRLTQVVPATSQLEQALQCGLGRHDLACNMLNLSTNLQAVAGNSLPIVDHAQGFILLSRVSMILLG
ncbi:MAG: hypothetical protein OXH24_10450 [Cyanobacteria bacterium MAG IRC3_bin_20]|nr:hypothetical protein [Cyanobacteria bacterium MAG IRC3_bin_20]